MSEDQILLLVAAALGVAAVWLASAVLLLAVVLV
jgi:hypothetical protein